MSQHLFANIVTEYGIYSNNRGENIGNLTTLPKLFWKGEVCVTVSSEALRWSMRYHWQQQGLKVNRFWNESSQDIEWCGLDKSKNVVHDPKRYIDDDVLGYMNILQSKAGKDGQRRRGVLEVARAISLDSASNIEVTFNSRSGEKGKKSENGSSDSIEDLKARTSLYSTETLSTQFQYGVALTPEKLCDRSRVMPIIDSLISLNHVGGNHARYLFDFSPQSIVFRLTEFPAPKILYCFERDANGHVICPDLESLVKAGDIDDSELWIMGKYAESEQAQRLKEFGVKLFRGIKEGSEELKNEFKS